MRLAFRVGLGFRILGLAFRVVQNNFFGAGFQGGVRVQHFRAGFQGCAKLAFLGLAFKVGLGSSFFLGLAFRMGLGSSFFGAGFQDGVRV